ncbi:hypothetical protein HDU67_007921 [Dinochytrium kinnereticum]|nr:hypothetical protein HDU67_007921 [Dinochytrium kinnereticum]
MATAIATTTTSHTMRRAMDNRDAIDFVLRASQAVLAVIGIISLVTTILASTLAIILPRNFSDRLPSYYYLLVTGLDFMYLWFWLATASTVTGLSNYCLSWNHLKYSPYTNCTGLGAAAAFGFFIFFLFIASLWLNFVPIFSGECTTNDFINGKGFASSTSSSSTTPLASIMVQSGLNTSGDAAGIRHLTSA